jgi:hypothetical protein
VKLHKFLVHYKTPKKRLSRTKEMIVLPPDGYEQAHHVEVLRREIIYLFFGQGKIVWKIVYLGEVGEV